MKYIFKVVISIFLLFWGTTRLAANKPPYDRNGYRYNISYVTNNGVTMEQRAVKISRLQSNRTSKYWYCITTWWSDDGLLTSVVGLDVKGDYNDNKYDYCEELDATAPNLEYISCFEVSGLQRATLGSTAYNPQKCSIGSNAFYMASKSLKHLTLTKAIESIGNSAFYQMTSGKIVCEGTPPKLEESAFCQDGYDNIIVVVPDNYYSQYANSTWKNFKHLFAERDINIELSFAHESYNVNIGDPIVLNLNTTAQESDITWTSSDKDIAEVSNGVVTGKKIGTATITAEHIISGKTATCGVCVGKNPTSITITPQQVFLNINECFTPTATILPEDATNTTIHWTSSNPKCVEINDAGEIKALRFTEGVLITATTENGLTASCRVMVVPSGYDNLCVVGDYKYCIEYNEHTASVFGFKDDNVHRTNGINIPESIEFMGETFIVTSVYPKAFSNASVSGELTLSETILSIGDYAFQNLNLLTGALTIPESVETIGDYAFINCSGFSENLHLSSSLNHIGKGAFSGCTKLSGELIIPDKVESIESDTFSDCRGFSGCLQLSSSLKSIGSNAFKGCENLSGNLIIPNQVESIGNYAFSNCRGFSGYLQLSSSLKSIDNSAFEKCEKLNGNLIIPDQVETIGNYAFSNCRGFNGNLLLSPSINHIGKGAFMKCTNLSGNLIIPDKVETIESDTFSDCRGFSGNLQLSSSLKLIDTNAFKGCENLSGDLIIPDQVEYIANYAFSNCSGFNGNLLLSSSLNYIGTAAFMGCFNLCGKLTIPLMLHSIYSNTFSGCSGFEELHLHSTITEIYGLAFYDTNFKTIYCEAKEPPMSGLKLSHKPSFSNNNYVNSVLVVPNSSIHNYQTTSEWSNFKNIRPKTVSVESLSLNETEIVCRIGESFNIVANISPDYASNKTLTWESDNPEIAKVDENGKVTAVSKGTAVITAKATDGSNVSASCNVTVIKLVSSIYISHTKISMKIGEQITLTAYALPNDATNTTLRWYSENEDVATVKDGVVSAIGPGSTYVVVESTDESDITEKCEIDIMETSDIDSISPETISVYVLNGIIYIENLPVNHVAYIFHDSGTLVKKELSIGNPITFQASSNNIYIVVLDNQCYKVVIR